MASNIPIQYYGAYIVRPTRRQALRALITGKSVELAGKQVSPLLKFGVETSNITVECWGGGGGASNG